MGKGARTAGLLGAAAGAVLVVATLPLEIAARGLPLRGGLWQLQTGSVAVWVVETLPLILGASAYALARGRVRVVQVAAAPAVAAPALAAAGPSPGAPPPPEPGSSPLPPPPPLPATLSGAQVLGVQAVDGRVHALQELVHTVREQAERVEAAALARNQAMVAMSAELRGPLTTILGRIDLLDGNADLGPDRLAQVREASLAARRLSQAVSSIVDLALVETGRLPLVLQEVDLARVVDEVRVLAQAAAEPPLTAPLGMRVAPEARMIRGDHDRVRQVLLLLVLRVAHLLPEVPLEVVVEPGTRPGWVSVRIGGPASAPAPRAELSAGPDPIPLTLARRMVEVLGGEFVPVLPGGAHVVQFQGSDRPAPEGSHAGRAGRSIAGQRVLLVSADPGIGALARSLERAGLSPRVEVAAASAPRSDVGLALVDLATPGAGQLVEALAEGGGRVVALSLRDEDLELALDHGAMAFLVQPVEPRVVLATLRRCMEA